MHSLKRFFALLFLCGLLVPSCYALPDGPPTPGETGPISDPAPAAPDTTPAPAGGGNDSGPSDPGTCAN